MSLPVTVNTIETSMQFTHALSGKRSYMVFATDKSSVGAPTFTDLEDLNDIYNSWMSTAIFGAGNLQALVHPNYVLTQSTSRQVLPGGPVRVTATSLAGTRAGEQMPAYSSLVVTQRTNEGGRHFTGRKYPPGPCEGDNVNGLPTSSYLTALLTAFEALRTTLAGSPPGWDQVVVSRVIGGAVRPVPQCAVIVGHTGDLQWDTQRRRGRP